MALNTVRFIVGIHFSSCFSVQERHLCQETADAWWFMSSLDNTQQGAVLHSLGTQIFEGTDTMLCEE